MTPSSGKGVREAHGSGMWFPGDRRSLERMVDGFIEGAAVSSVPGRIVSAIAPHAGYIYSGPVAGFTFRGIRDNARQAGTPEAVVVLGFSHRAAFRGVALMDGEALRTPLGETALDREAGAMLAAGRPRVVFSYAPHAGEHSAENQVPFVQRALPAAKLVVGLMGDHDPGTLKEILAGLADLAAKKRIVLVASSDMLHDADYDLVSSTDRMTLEKVAAMDHEGILGDWAPHRQTFCGLMPVLAAMRMAGAQGCRKGTVLHYRNSGDDHPESRGQWVVGYGAVVFAV